MKPPPPKPDSGNVGGVDTRFKKTQARERPASFRVLSELSAWRHYCSSARDCDRSRGTNKHGISVSSMGEGTKRCTTSRTRMMFTSATYVGEPLVSYEGLQSTSKYFVRKSVKNTT